MEQNLLVLAIQERKIEWSVHALRRMLQRDISREAVKQVINSGAVIEDYPEDKPFPCALFLGMWEKRPLHVVVAYDGSSRNVFVVTAYWPDEEHFESDFKTRRKM
jgi:hypothetical protein